MFWYHFSALEAELAQMGFTRFERKIVLCFIIASSQIIGFAEYSHE